jgi:surface polysaccharide O-acyltransferase-like enzyme
MQFCYFSGYIAFFIAGTLAYRYSWLTTLSAVIGRSWGLTALFAGLVYWFALLILGGAFSGQGGTFSGGWHWQSAGLCLLEALAGVGISIGCLALFREKFNRQGRWASFFSANAFAVYVFHPPILIVITRAMGGLHYDPLLKFLLATIFSIAFTNTLSTLLFRRLPVVKTIL